MAISKILCLKDCGSSFHGRHLRTVLEYITKPEKTQDGRLVSAVNCLADSAFEQMKETKLKFHKPDKRQGYHIILSFKAGETDPDTVFELTQKFVNEYLGNDYEAVFAVHDNTDHPHSHIIFNSVSFKDGKKYHYKKGDWEREIQPITNRLCEEYGLSTIELEGKRPGEEWKESRDGKFVWADMIRKDVDISILQASSYESFLACMEERGYVLKNAHGEGKYLAVKPPGMERMMRLKTLGADYTAEQIRKRILTKDVPQMKRTEIRPKIISCRVRVKRYKRMKLSGLQKRYFAKLYRTGKLKKKAYSDAWKYKDEIRKMHRLQEQYLFLVRHDVHSMKQLQLVAEELADKKEECFGEKDRLYRMNRKNKRLYEIAAEMGELTECEHAYQNGDDFFEEDHIRYCELKEKLKERGYSYEEIVKLKEYYKNEAVRYNTFILGINKEIRLADSIRREYERAEKPEREQFQEKGTEKQPDKGLFFS